MKAQEITHIARKIAQQCLSSPELQTIKNKLMSGCDASLAVNHAARALCLTSLYLDNPRPFLVVVAGEDAALHFSQHLSSYLGQGQVIHFPERKDLPWSDTEIDKELAAQRCEALDRMNLKGNAHIMVCSARSLIRYIPPDQKFYQPLHYCVGDECDPQKLCRLLERMGYESVDKICVRGEFSYKGDTLDLWPASASAAVRIEFFGDEIERIRSLLHLTGQTIADKTQVWVYPSRELCLDDKAVLRAVRKLSAQAEEDQDMAFDLSRLEQGICFNHMEKYLPHFYPQQASLFDHLPQNTLVVLVEPRSLFDDSMRAFEEIRTGAYEASERLEGLYQDPRSMDFGNQQRLHLVSLLRAGGAADAELTVIRPEVRGKENRLTSRLRALCAQRYHIVLALPDRSTREHFALSLSDEHLPFQETLSSQEEKTLQPSIVNITDLPLPAGTILPSARLAVISLGDLAQRSTRRIQKSKLDITDITFPFKPGDYVVHATHGIALFKSIVRQELAGFERDYFLLEYAAEDKLYVPLEQVDKLTRYIGPDSSHPRLTRLNTSDWSRATGKARNSAKKLAFDLVDLYARRSTIKGYAYTGDSAEQREMEASFPYQETPDQLAAIADIKADMESDKPMDRLLCGDVGFGKTEVALRAAFKAVQDDKQVMILCPTTILAQQHFMTFFERFAPFDVEVEVLSRFRSSSQQRSALERFAQGKVKVLVGTHRLLSRDVNPYNLGLIIIDEEQRFGVQHKEQLKTLREQVDVLTLSATPIPRTMQMALSGVRDMSLIKTPPANRTPVKVHVGEWDEDLISAALRLEMSRGGQAYYVSNRVKTIEEAAARVLEIVPEARIECAHGQMSEKELERIMESFSAGEFDILIATTIIESGIDNPRTNTLIIEDSQRLGLAQLYQLKGRVGRSKVQAYAYFMFPPAEVLSEQAVQRLLAIEELQDLGSGMDIAMRDLEIRGAGSLMGADQSGNLSSVGFDLFMQMLAEAVSLARGEGEIKESEVNLQLNGDYYLSEAYIPMTDERVRAYRRLASASSLEQLNKLEFELEQRYGALEQAGRNLLDRERIKLRSQRLQINAIGLVSSKLVFQNVELPSELKAKFARKGGVYYPKSRKLSYPFHKEEDELLPAVLMILEQLGGGDEDEDDQSPEFSGAS